MQLIIDLGNTQIKYFVFDDNRDIDTRTVSYDHWENTLTQLQREYPLIEKCIVSDVNRSITADLQRALVPLPVILCSADLRLPFKTLYAPSHQLGADRVALLAACTLEYPNQNVLVIDLGSCITYDILDREGLHHGGAISPGYRMRYNAMHSFSGLLPALEPKKTAQFFGTNTESAMHSGVSQGIISEIQTAISYYEAKFDFLTIILTGGDAQMLPKPLKNSIFAHSNFLAKGLNFLLASNTNS
jgi:type III pantothenate kinase